MPHFQSVGMCLLSTLAQPLLNKRRVELPPELGLVVVAVASTSVFPFVVEPLERGELTSQPAHLSQGVVPRSLCSPQ